MRKLLIAGACMLSALSATHSARATVNEPYSCADAGPAKPLLMDNQRILLKNSCEEVSVTALRATADEKLQRSLEMWQRELGDLWIPRRAYRYSLIIANNRKTAVSLTFPDSNFLGSPYVWTYGAMEFQLEPCSSTRVEFLSPQTPRAISIQGWKGAETGSIGWVTGTFGETLFLIPQGSLFHRSLVVRSEPLTKAEAARYGECTFMR